MGESVSGVSTERESFESIVSSVRVTEVANWCVGDFKAATIFLVGLDNHVAKEDVSPSAVVAAKAELLDGEAAA